jgi:hypothetical protein
VNYSLLQFTILECFVPFAHGTTNSRISRFQEVRSKSKITTPSGRNTVPNVSYLPDPNESFLNKDKVQYKGGFAQLAKRNSLRIIDYTETSGSGKTLGRKRTRSKTK